MDLSEFMLAPLSMSDTGYALWSLGVAYVNRLGEGLDYDEFNNTRLMHSLTAKVLLFLNTCTRMPLLPAFLLTFLICLGWSMLMALMALLGSIRCPTTQMSWAITFQTAHNQ